MRWLCKSIVSILFTCAAGSGQAQHVHVQAGAVSPTPGSRAALVDPPENRFSARFDYVFHLLLRTNGPASGFYDSGITFTAAGIDPLVGGPERGHAAAGSQLALVVRSLAGPADSSFGFWESAGCEDFGAGITFSLAPGETNGSNSFLLSQNNGLPGEDPYGHCHGRRLTVTRPGLHTLGVQVVDRSRHGPGGGPIHLPSELYYLHLQAGFTISRLERTNDESRATFATRQGSRFYLEANSDLDQVSSWTTVAGPLFGDNYLRTLVDPGAPTEARRFYRLRVTTP